MIMKKFLMLAFVSMAMLSMVSCSDDDEKESSKLNLKNTSWQCVHTFSMMGQSITLDIALDFTSDKDCEVAVATMPDITSLLPFDLSGQYTYKVNKTKVIIQTGGQLGNLEMECHNNDMLIFTVPSSYRTYIGTSELIFHKK